MDSFKINTLGNRRSMPDVLVLCNLINGMIDRPYLLYNINFDLFIEPMVMGCLSFLFLWYKL